MTNEFWRNILYHQSQKYYYSVDFSFDISKISFKLCLIVLMLLIKFYLNKLDFIY